MKPKESKKKLDILPIHGCTGTGLGLGLDIAKLYCTNQLSAPQCYLKAEAGCAYSFRIST